MTSPLRILVGVHGGTLSGIDTYAEQIAAAGAHGRNSVTLIVLEGPRTEALKRRAEEAGVRVVAGAPLGQSRLRKLVRQSPKVAARELRARLANTLEGLGETFDVAHLNHPAVASAARPYADRVVVAAWFFPHSRRGRWRETWRHTGGHITHSLPLAVKSLLYYQGDESGYRESDCAVAPTVRLTRQLLAQGIHSVTSAPPCSLDPHPGSVPPPRRSRTAEREAKSGAARLVICCGDLTHPRKNVRAGLEAVRLLAGSGRRLELELIGRHADRLSQEIGRLPGNVRVTAPGVLSVADVRSRFSCADILLLPSLYEEWGYVATEAASSGARVVALPVYPFDEMLLPPLGACACDQTSAALAAALERVLDTPVRRAEVRSAAEGRFGVEAAGRRLDAIWSEVSPVGQGGA